jgi:PIN domain nuclease of toxin-antitoxin system
VELLSRLGISADKRIVLYSGAVGEKQGLESLLAMAGMAQSAGMSDLLFIIAGDGPYVRTLKLMARQSDLANIMFIPLLNDDDFPDMLQSAWLHLVLQRDVSGEHFMPSKLYPILAAGGLACISPVSPWELAIKVKAGKLTLPLPPLDYCISLARRHRLTVPAEGLDAALLCAAAELPLIHRDPFDRILVATALRDHLTVLTDHPGERVLEAAHGRLEPVYLASRVPTLGADPVEASVVPVPALSHGGPAA